MGYLRFLNQHESWDFGVPEFRVGGEERKHMKLIKAKRRKRRERSDSPSTVRRSHPQKGVFFFFFFFWIWILRKAKIIGIRLIKFFAWEDSFLYKIGVARASELYWLTYSAYLRAGVFFFWLTTPLIVSLVTFAVYVGTGNELDAQTAFTALSLFNILRFPLNILPTTVAQVVGKLIELIACILFIYRALHRG